jgi:hypothetical protein
MKTTDLDGEGIIASWNSLYPIGTPVRYWRDIRAGEGRSGVTRSAATLLGGHTPVVWIDNIPGAIDLTDVEVAIPRVVEPCDICRYPKAGHGIRYVALHGDHEWRDPYAHTAALSAPKRPAPTEPEPCSCSPNEFCQRCDPWREQRSTAPVVARQQAALPGPGPFARIYDAARRTA